jgi:hypothetical protein
MLYSLVYAGGVFTVQFVHLMCWHAALEHCRLVETFMDLLPQSQQSQSSTDEVKPGIVIGF